MFRTFLCIGVAAWLAGCSPNYSANNYDSTAVQRANKVDQGIIVGRRVVDVTPSGTTGAVAGAAAGGIAGSQVGNGVTQAFGALGGGLIGGVMGEAAEKSAGKTVAYEYIVRVAGKDLVSVTQQDTKPLDIGTKVLVINGTQARIVPDYTVAVDPAPAAPNTDPTAKLPPPVGQAPLPAPGTAAPGSATPAVTPPAAPTAPPAAASAPAPSPSAESASPPPEAASPAPSSPAVPVPQVLTARPGTPISPSALLPPPAELAPAQ